MPRYTGQSPKTMYIMRGLPGSGKSTLARRLAGLNGVVYSTDDFFIVDGAFVFDGSKIVANHILNQARARRACEAGISPIVIDNVTAQRWEARPYVLAALQHGYRVVFAEADTPWCRDVDELHRRNLHGTPRETIENMMRKYEDHSLFTVANVLKSSRPR